MKFVYVEQNKNADPRTHTNTEVGVDFGIFRFQMPQPLGIDHDSRQQAYLFCTLFEGGGAEGATARALYMEQ